MNVRNKTITCRYAWINNQIEENVCMHIDSNGIISNISSVSDGIVLFDHHLVVPGFVNTHSHAFHRYLRGKSEIGKSAADTFWKWRDNMYGLVANVDKKRIYEYCYATFKEMLKAGITTVGEFHYVHHSDEKFDLDQSVIQAAIDSGIRIVLLQTLYEHAGFDRPPLHPVQQRFVSSLPDFMESVKRLRSDNNHERVSLGVAAHSARAVSFENIGKLYDYAVAEDLPFHIHLEEQPKEILDFQRFTGTKQSPSDHMLSHMSLNDNFTAVHATYTSGANMQKFAKNNANVSICPCTEGYLGDGVPNINEGLSISFGTDCNNRISFVEEMRWACFTQQMVKNSRSVCGLSAEKLLKCATINGAKSLKLMEKIGSFEVGKHFDAVVFELEDENLIETTAETIVDTMVFSYGNREIQHVFVDGIDRK